VSEKKENKRETRKTNKKKQRWTEETSLRLSSCSRLCTLCSLQEG
jgi:hypothetical protein